MTNAFRMHAPVDPECPKVSAYADALYSDPIQSGCEGEFMEAFESKHMAACAQCQEYGTANIEVVGP